MRRSVLDRFLAGFIRGPVDQCWPWLRSCSSGYGVLRVSGRLKYAHRLSYEVYIGLIPVGMEVKHDCDNSLCVNPTHLCLGSHASNMADMACRGRSAHTGLYGDDNPSRMHPERLARGVQHGQAKLNDRQVLEVRRLRATGLTQRKLASLFSVSREQIKNIVNNKHWRHLL